MPIDCSFEQETREKEEQRHVEEIDDLVDRCEFRPGIDQSGAVQPTPYMPEDYQNYAGSAQSVDPIDPVLHFILAVDVSALASACPAEAVCDIGAPFPRSKLHFCAIHV
jgi:hypothetical protein